MSIFAVFAQDSKNRLIVIGSENIIIRID